MDMETIEQRAKAYAGARSQLAVEVQALQDEIERVKRRRMDKIKAALVDARACHDDLKAAVEDSPERFARPKTQIFHGIKVGYQKGKGKMIWSDEAKVIERIYERLPGQADQLIKVTEKPVKKALEQLDTSQLKRLGITIEDTGDQVVIKPVDSDIDKLVNALLRDELDELEEEAA